LSYTSFFVQDLQFVHQRVRRICPEFNGRLWTVMPAVFAELQWLYEHAHCLQADYSSPATFKFWHTHSTRLPLLSIIAQAALVTPIVTTVVENVFGLLGALLLFSFVCAH
jgi:hypothetical protein